MENIKNKIKKLLVLATSPNEHEAKAALLKARELMAKHKINENDVTEKKREVIDILTDITCTKRKNAWIINLSDIIADNYCCAAYRSRRYKAKKNTVGFIGLDEDIEICINIFKYAVDCVLANIKSIKKEYKEIYTNNFLNKLCESYGFGFCTGVYNAFEEQNRQKQEYALVLVQPREVTEALEEMKSECFKRIDLSTNEQMKFALLGLADGENFRPEVRIKHEGVNDDKGKFKK